MGWRLRMEKSPPASERIASRLPLVAGVVALVCAALAAGYLLGRQPPLPPVTAAPEAVDAVEEPPAPAGPRVVPLPLEGVARLAPLGGTAVCALGGRRLTCSEDAGATWDEPVELPAAVLAVVRFGDTRLAAAVDGTVYELRGEAPPSAWASPPAELAVVDATSRGETLWLLAHRYDVPEEELKLPRVVETVILAVGPAGTLERRGGLRGYGGERILVEPGDAVVTWAPFDLRAWRSRDGGAHFRRLGAHQRFGADFGGLQVAVERRTDRLPGPGRPARPASALLVSPDGERWETVWEMPGELLVDFADSRTGVVIARGEGLAVLTRDGGGRFDPLWEDPRLDDATALVHVDGGFLAATPGGEAILLPLPDEPHQDHEQP